MHTGHVEALETRHAEVEARLHDETNRPLPDSIACAEMKKRKLALKDELAREGV